MSQAERRPATGHFSLAAVPCDAMTLNGVPNVRCGAPNEEPAVDDALDACQNVGDGRKRFERILRAVDRVAAVLLR